MKAQQVRSGFNKKGEKDKLGLVSNFSADLNIHMNV